MPARVDIETRVTLSILDRLIDEEPDHREEPLSSRLQDLRSLKKSLWRDVSALLNTKRRDPEVPEVFEEAKQSLLNFGIPDFTSWSLRDPTIQNRLRRAVENAIRTFEPRLSAVSVTLQARDDLEPSLRFRVDALLRIDPAPEPVAFDTVLQPDVGRFVVVGEAR